VKQIAMQQLMQMLKVNKKINKGGVKNTNKGRLYEELIPI
jgi:hypothetical protein